MKPILVERYADNGQLSHYELIDDEGNVLWTQSDESPSPSLQEAAEAYAQNEYPSPDKDEDEYSFHLQNERQEKAAEHFIAGWNAREAQGPPTISKTETLQEAAAKCASRKYVECGGSILAMIECFKEGTVWQAQQTGPILTRELHDKIWEAAQDRLAYDTADGKPFSYAPDKETFYKSLTI